MSTSDLILHGLTVAGSGGAGWFGVWLKHRRTARLERKAEHKLKDRVDSLEADHRAHLQQLSDHIVQYKANNAGWLLELEGIRNDISQDQELKDAIEKERHSRPDPLEDMHREISEMRKAVERLKERSGKYVKNEALAIFVHSQEEQWREMNRHLGRLEGMLK